MEDITLENNQVVVKNRIDLQTYVTREQQRIEMLQRQVNMTMTQLNEAITRLNNLLK